MFPSWAIRLHDTHQHERYMWCSKKWKATKQPDLTTSFASRSITSDQLRSSGCLTRSMNVCASTASLRYGGNREFVGKHSRWRRQKNGLPQGSVHAPLLFNIIQMISLFIPIGEQTPELSAPLPCMLCVSHLLSTHPQSGADHRMLQISSQF